MVSRIMFSPAIAANVSLNKAPTRKPPTIMKSLARPITSSGAHLIQLDSVVALTEGLHERTTCGYAGAKDAAWK